MRIHTLPVICLLACAIASPIQLVTRDARVIVQSLEGISRTLSKLEYGMSRVPSGGSIEEARKITDYLLGLQSEYIEDLRRGQREIRRAPMAAAGDIPRLISLVDEVGNRLQPCMIGWIKSKTMVVAARQKDIVLERLLTTSDAMLVFSEAAISKLPPPTQGIASMLKNQHGIYIENAVSAYRR
jgi:hypothetical protein